VKSGFRKEGETSYSWYAVAASENREEIRVITSDSCLAETGIRKERKNQ